MINSYGYQQYKEQSINTMTKGEMLILLYDEAIKRLIKAEMALKSEDYGLFDESVVRAKDIFRYLTDTLDKKYPISNELSRLYDFFNYELSRIHAGRNVEIINEIKPMIVGLRDTFKEAEKKTR